MDNKLSLDYVEDDVEYCVKTGLMIPGGCDVQFCLDITGCPYRPAEIELNPTDE